MTKIKKIFICGNCGVESLKWVGKCPSCSEWNTIIEEIISKETTSEKKHKDWNTDNKDTKPISISDIVAGNSHRVVTTDPELNRVLGGGIVAGSMVLIAGQPGIGKSTLLLQISGSLRDKILYVSGEESAEQIKMRAERMNVTNDECYILTETNVNKVLTQAQSLSPSLLIIDSIQTLSSPYIDSASGSISQIRECAAALQQYAKSTNVPVFIIGHINKEGSIAGPKLMEHIVDVVLQFEGDRHYSYRILRTGKNRFGSTDEIGIYEMHSTGMRPVTNPSEMLLSQNKDRLSGSSVGVSLEGNRPLLIETQALVSQSVYGTPQRSATGYDNRRLNMLLAVMEKRCGLPFSQKDVFLNMAGGLKVSDPAIDLSVVTALISSLQDIYVENKVCFAGEIGLSGEIRTVPKILQRIQEAEKLGFAAIYLSEYNMKGIDQENHDIEIKTIGHMGELIEKIFA